MFEGRIGRMIRLMDDEGSEVTASDVLQVMQEEFDDVLTRVRNLERTMKRAFELLDEEKKSRRKRGVDPSRWKK